MQDTTAGISAAKVLVDEGANQGGTALIDFEVGLGLAEEVRVRQALCAPIDANLQRQRFDPP